MLAALVLPAPVRSQTTVAAGSDPSSKGAEVYCFMRQSGNDHEVSWTAAYALIKRQSASLFKTSPQHGAVMITEAVVNNPSAFPDCGRYLGALFGSEQGASAPTQRGTADNSAFAEGPMAIPSGGTTRDDRYNY
ncbi:penicillin amidase [Synechococcus sp. SynAce01]|nr:penicillin amidase [Synechococcus sp. SynAce01]